MRAVNTTQLACSGHLDLSASPTGSAKRVHTKHESSDYHRTCLFRGFGSIRLADRFQQEKLIRTLSFGFVIYGKIEFSRRLFCPPGKGLSVESMSSESKFITGIRRYVI
jgi:hypothetical protein